MGTYLIGAEVAVCFTTVSNPFFLLNRTAICGRGEEERQQVAQVEYLVS